MKRKVVLNADALADFREAAAWYDGQRKGLGKRFTQAFRAATAPLARQAEIHAKIYGNTRRVRIEGFEYYVAHYIVRLDQVIVFSVFHSSRDPQIWQIRADDLEQS
jgi:plasmid stabilization system protein ParE